MTPRDRATARRQIDKRLTTLTNPDALARPPRGWVKAIREALGMTAEQLGQRLGVSKQRVLALEKAEASGSVTVESLKRAAQAMGCRLVYTLVPGKPLESIVEERAAKLARQRLRVTRHSMALEDQSVDSADEEAQLRRMTQEILASAGSALWEEE